MVALYQANQRTFEQIIKITTTIVNSTRWGQKSWSEARGLKPDRSLELTKKRNI